MTQSAATTDILGRVRQRYGRVLSHLELASREAEAPLSEQQIWHLMARTVSSRWASAYATLQAAQQRMTYLHSNENKPLGSIGAALESEYTNAAEVAYLSAQSDFTMIDESLRGKKFLNMLLEDLVARQKSLEVSMGISEGVLKLTLDMPLASSTAPKPLRESFGSLGTLARKLATLVRKPAPALPAKP